MKEAVKKICKSRIFLCLLTAIIVGTGSVYAMTYFPSNQTTYDNSNSGLESTNVQGAIDELYKVCFPPTIIGGNGLLENVDVVTAGDGLYSDEYEDGKYTYKGANPNNYVTFNNEQAGWRIISINSDGTIKIMRDDDIGNQAWDSSNSNNWNRPATLNTYLNSTYYNSLTSTAQSQIVETTYYAGAVTSGNNDMQDQISDEKVRTSKVKVALPTLSEYLRACSNISCKTFNTYNSNYSTCKKSDWMFNSDTWWTLSPYSSSSITVFFVDYKNGIANPSNIFSGHATYNAATVRPTVTLSSEIKITGGDGSQSNPYIIQ